MPPLPSARRSMADSGRGSADHLDSHNYEGAQPKQITRQSQDLNPRPTGLKSETSTEVPEFQAGLETRLQSRSYLSEDVKKKIIQKHEKPVFDKYAEDLNALREGHEGAQPAQAGVADQNRLEEAARAKLQAGLMAVQPAMAQELKALEGLIIAEYEPLVRTYLIDQAKNRLATLKRDNASRARGRPVKFTRAEVAEAGEVWKAKRIALGLPLEGHLDDLDPGEIVSGPTEDLDPTAEGGPSANASVEEHSDNGSDGDAMDFESGSEEEGEQEQEQEQDDNDDDDDDTEEDEEQHASESPFTVDGHESST